MPAYSPAAPHLSPHTPPPPQRDSIIYHLPPDPYSSAIRAAVALWVIARSAIRQHRLPRAGVFNTVRLLREPVVVVNQWRISTGGERGHPFLPMGTHHKNGRRSGQPLRSSLQAFYHLTMPKIPQQQHKAAAVGQVKQVHPAHRIAFRACAHLAISSSITVADSEWGCAG